MVDILQMYFLEWKYFNFCLKNFIEKCFEGAVDKLKLIQFTIAYGLMQERRNSSANALELHLSCINPSI